MGVGSIFIQIVLLYDSVRGSRDIGYLECYIYVSCISELFNENQKSYWYEFTLVLLTLAWTLRENPKDRPNIYEVVKAVSILRGSEIPIRDVLTINTMLT